jgi:peptidoglycan/LPS O-acetylase OafA/YrhL
MSSHSQVESAREDQFDAARGIAACIVVLCHALAAFQPTVVFGAGRPGPTSIWHVPPFSLVSAGFAAVAFFFVLSGLVLSKRYLTTGITWQVLLGFSGKRFLRLGGLVWVTGLASYVWLVGPGYQNHEVALITTSQWLDSFWQSPHANITSALKAFLIAPFLSMAQWNPPLWTIQIELYGSLLVYFLLFCCRWIDSNLAKQILLALVAIALCQTPYASFVFGMLIASGMGRSNERGMSAGWIAWLLAFGLLLCSLPYYLLDNAQYLPALPRLWGGWVMVGAVLVVFSLNHATTTMRKFFALPLNQWLGRHSFAIYALHFPILGSIGCMNFLHWQSTALAILCVFSITFMLAPLATRLIDVPCTRIGQALSQRIISKFTPGQARSPIAK